MGKPVISRSLNNRSPPRSGYILIFFGGPFSPWFKIALFVVIGYQKGKSFNHLPSRLFRQAPISAFFLWSSLVQSDNKLFSEVVLLTTFLLTDISCSITVNATWSPKYHDYWTDIRSERINERFVCFAMFILFTYTRITFKTAKICLPVQREQDILQLEVATTLGACRCISSTIVTLGSRQFSCHQVWYRKQNAPISLAATIRHIQ